MKQEAVGESVEKTQQVGCQYNEHHKSEYSEPWKLKASLRYIRISVTIDIYASQSLIDCKYSKSSLIYFIYSEPFSKNDDGPCSRESPYIFGLYCHLTRELGRLRLREP